MRMKMYEQSCSAWGETYSEIRTCRFMFSHNPLFNFSFLLHFLITKTLVSSNISGEVTGFVSDFLSPDRQSVPGFGRAVFSYGLRSTFVEHNICGQMLFASLLPSPSSVPPCADSLPCTFDFWPPLFRIASRLSGDPIQKSPGHPLHARSALACCPPQKYPKTHPTTLCSIHQPRAQWFSRPWSTTCRVSKFIVSSCESPG